MKLAAFLAARARDLPDKDALVCGADRVSFAELHAQSNQIATYLRRSGVGVGDRVAICLPNCCEFVTIFFGVVKCGAIAMPINMRLSAKEIQAIFNDASPAAVFFGEDERAVIESMDGANRGLRKIVLGGRAADAETDLSSVLGIEAEEIDVPVAFDDCLISYTSGTTGRPKGVITTQANYIVANGFLNGIHWRITSDDRIAITTSLAHRAAFARVGNMAVLGATLYITPRFDVSDVSTLIESEKISLISVVPTVARMMIGEIEARPKRFESLRVLVATGEAFPVDIKRRLLAALPNLQIFSFFAMTEAGSLAMLSPAEQLTHGNSVGRITPGLEMRLVDAAGADVSVGEAGEILVRSGLPGQYLLFRTYFNQPEAMQHAFQDGWFKTGDIGRLDDDGYLYIVDRKKDMVLSGGYNVYSKEVELVLAEHQDVLDAAVIGVPDEVYGEAVAAFVEKAPDANVTSQQLINWCTDKLAGYKKPRHIVFLDALPRNGTGKVIKGELRESFKNRTPAPDRKP